MPLLVGVTFTVKTRAEVAVTEPMVMAALPALPKAAAVTVLAFMSLLKVTV